MTEFEQQVRQSLSEINVLGFLTILRTAGKDGSEDAVRAYFDVLGVRVAAAIEAGIAFVDAKREDPTLADPRSVALMALRGEVPMAGKP